MKRSEPQSDYSFVHKLSLWVSVLLFLFVFAYWFIDTNSNASLLNLILEKWIDPTTVAKKNGSIGWIRFLLHLALTGYALFLFYKSQAAKWLGIKIALLAPISNFLHQNYARSKALKVGLQLVLGLGLIYTIYQFIMGIVAGSAVPVEVFQFFLLFYFINLIVWEINFSKPQQQPEWFGFYDHRDTVKWIRLGNHQVAYIQDHEDSNTWHLIADEDANLSYRSTYIFNTRKFNISLKNQSLVNTNFGKIDYDCSVSLYGLNNTDSSEDHLIIKNFPSRLSYAQVNNLNELSQEDTASTLLQTLIHQTGTVERLENKITSISVEVSKFKDETSVIQYTDWKKEYRRIYNIIEEGSISVALRADFQAQFDGIFPNVFKIHVAIVNDSVHTAFRESIAAIKARQDAEETQKLRQAEGRINTLVETAAKQAGERGRSYEEIQKILRMAWVLGGLNNPAYGQENILLDENSIQKFGADGHVKSELIAATDAISQIIEEGKLKEYTDADIKEKIARETSFFKEHNIAPERFFDLLFQKARLEGAERIALAKQQVIKDTLVELYIKAL